MTDKALAAHIRALGDVPAEPEIRMVGDCTDCVDQICTMNCSTATPATDREWLAASFWHDVFPKKASAAQIQEWRAAGKSV